MSNYTLSKDALLAHLRDQIYFIIDSAISYDNGFEGEAKRLAANIRILVHDTRSCSALLTQLNKMNILFYDSASAFDPMNRLTSNCLTTMKVSAENRGELKGEYIAPLDNLSGRKSKNRKVSFDRWQKRNIIYKDNVGSEFNRRDLILNVADKEGGAHVDPKLDQSYASLSKSQSLAQKIRTSDGRVKEFENSPIPPSIRQISHEVLKTLKDEVVDLFEDKQSLIGRFHQYEKHCLELKDGMT